MKLRFTIALLMVVLLIASSAAMAYEREETLIYGGGLWATPSNFNPLHWDPVTGTNGIVYENLFHYNPITNEYTPWLAKNGEWIAYDVYQIELRSGITWTDGEPFTAHDVKFTYELARDNALPYSPVWRWIKEIKVVSDHIVQFVFENPSYHEWQTELYARAIIPEHIFSKVPPEDLMVINNSNPVGTGPYMFDSTGPDRMVWMRNDNWWGNEVFGQPKPKYLVNLVINENNVALGMLMKRELDLSNYFIPGVPAIKNTFGLTTWFADQPHMLAANTALLFLNSTKKPLDDVKLRRALAYAIDPSVIAERVFENQVTISNPAGLFNEGWMDFYSEEVANEYGFAFDADKARALLDEAGYKDVDGDGWRDQPNGDKMQFDIIVPSGWTDWMESIRVIAENLRAVGINANPSFPDYSVYYDALVEASFDMAINNFGSGVSATPYSYWNWVANHNIHREQVTEGNWGRYDDQELFDLIAEFNRLPVDDPKAKEIAGGIQQKLLEGMPSIPLWQNGLWAQSTSMYWTNWPTEENPLGWPCSWGGHWQFGAVEMLINLKPAQ